MTNCPNCGAPVNPRRMTCEYCGTRVKQDLETFRIVVDRPGVHVLQARFVIDDAVMHAITPQEASKIAIEQMAHKLSDGIAQFMTVDHYYDFERMDHHFSGRLRVCDSDFRF